jgi:hypothetical protein
LAAAYVLLDKLDDAVLARHLLVLCSVYQQGDNTTLLLVLALFKRHGVMDQPALVPALLRLVRGLQIGVHVSGLPTADAQLILWLMHFPSSRTHA